MMPPVRVDKRLLVTVSLAGVAAFLSPGSALDTVRLTLAIP
jgi:hypothetical protein